MGGFTFCCGDFVNMMDAKGTVTAEILEMIEDDPRVCYINSDSTVGRVAEAMKKYPDRVLDTGIQEMNMVTVAAGLAKEGFIPFVQTFGPFLCVRALDQIHNDVCYNDFPVRLIGTHAGLSSGYGPTHNTIIEFGIMNALPNMTVIVPADATETRKAVLACADIPGPVYVRVGRAKTEIIYDDSYDFVPGKAHVIRHGKDIAIYAMGIMVAKAIKAAEILSAEGIDCSVVNVSTIKPLDRETVLAEAKGKKGIITCEEHSVMGGLNSVISQTLSSDGLGVKCVPVAVMDVFGESGTADELLEKHGLTADAIAEKARILNM